MATAKTARTATTTRNARPKTLGATALTGEQGDTLRRLQSKIDRGVALNAEQKAEHKRLEAMRVARNEYTRQLRQRAAGKKPAAARATTTAEPAAQAKPASPAKLRVVPAVPDAMRLSKVELIGAIKAAVAGSDGEYRLGMMEALRLAEQLDD